MLPEWFSRHASISTSLLFSWNCTGFQSQHALHTKLLHWHTSILKVHSLNTSPLHYTHTLPHAPYARDKNDFLYSLQSLMHAQNPLEKGPSTIRHPSSGTLYPHPFEMHPHLLPSNQTWKLISSSSHMMFKFDHMCVCECMFVWLCVVVCVFVSRCMWACVWVWTAPLTGPLTQTGVDNSHTTEHS